MPSWPSPHNRHLLSCIFGILPAAAFATGGAYVLMNIPYAEFYRAELGETDAVDAVSEATSSCHGIMDAVRQALESAKR